MEIPYHLLRTTTAREMVAALLRDGFVFRRQKGSHHRYNHPDGRRVTVAFSNATDTFRVKTLQAMIEKQARWTGSDLHRLRLLD